MVFLPWIPCHCVANYYHLITIDIYKITGYELPSHGLCVAMDAPDIISSVTNYITIWIPLNYLHTYLSTITLLPWILLT